MSHPTLWRGATPAVWGDLFDTRRQVDRLFDRFFDRAATGLPTSLYPVVDVRETKDAIEVTAELPGLRPDDVDVSIENGVLTIAGEKRQESTEDNEAAYRVTERTYGRFERSFTLPRTVSADKIDARFAHGVLTVTLPKVEAAKPRRIQVAVAK